MEHVKDWCFRDIYKGCLREDDVYALDFVTIGLIVVLCLTDVSTFSKIRTIIKDI